VNVGGFTYDALLGRVLIGAGAVLGLLGAELDRCGARRLLLCCTEQEEPLARELTGPFAAPTP
jgi:hypothetical protein